MCTKFTVSVELTRSLLRVRSELKSLDYTKYLHNNCMY